MSNPSGDKTTVICFCFGHVVGDIERCHADGTLNTLMEEIAQACRDGRADCARLNPSGRCCLGEFKRIQSHLMGTQKTQDGCCHTEGSE